MEKNANNINLIQQKQATPQTTTPQTTTPLITKDQARINVLKDKAGLKQLELNPFEKVHNQLVELNKKQNNENSGQLLEFLKGTLKIAGKFTRDVIKPADSGKFQETLNILKENNPELLNDYISKYLEILVNPKPAAFSAFMTLSKKVENVLDNKESKDRIEPILF